MDVLALSTSTDSIDAVGGNFFVLRRTALSEAKDTLAATWRSLLTRVTKAVLAQDMEIHTQRKVATEAMTAMTVLHHSCAASSIRRLSLTHASGRFISGD